MQPDGPGTRPGKHAFPQGRPKKRPRTAEELSLPFYGSAAKIVLVDGLARSRVLCLPRRLGIVPGEPVRCRSLGRQVVLRVEDRCLARTARSRRTPSRARCRPSTSGSLRTLIQSERLRAAATDQPQHDPRFRPRRVLDPRPDGEPDPVQRPVACRLVDRGPGDDLRTQYGLHGHGHPLQPGSRQLGRRARRSTS